MEMKKLRRVVIKEELVELTGDFKSAVVLNQLLYWSERRKDADKFIEEEKARLEKYATHLEESAKADVVTEALSHGWIYKTAEELSAECMIGLSNATMGRILKKLIQAGWIDERNNPRYKWDRTKQYRVNILKIQQDLNKIGYALEGYSLGMTLDSIFQNEKCKIQNEKCKIQNEKSKVQNEKAIPKITTKITNKNYNKEIRKGEDESSQLSCSILSNINQSNNSPLISEINETIIPNDSNIDKYIIGLLKKDKELKSINFNEGEYYMAFIESIVATQLQDSVEILSLPQWRYFRQTLLNKIQFLLLEK